MRRITCLVIALVSGTLTCAADAWVEKAPNPSWFPYKAGPNAAGGEMDLPIPTATNQPTGDLALTSIWPNLVVQLTCTDDPLRGTQGYWPTFHAIGIFANGKYYVGGGVGPNINMGNFWGGYGWPSNSYSTSPNNGDQGYSYNRQSMFAVYDPVANTWEAAKWDGTGPRGYPNMAAITPGVYSTDMPLKNDGTWIGSNQAFAYDRDGDGIEEIFMHGGYPQWNGHFAVYNPASNAWTRTSDALNFSSGLKAQMYGGCVRIGAEVFVIGGRFWGPDNHTHMQVYNITNDSWTVYEYLYNRQLQFFGIAPVGTKIYMMGGEEAGGGAAYSDKVYVLDTTNIAAGIQVVGNIPVAVRWPSVISWKGMLYLVGGTVGHFAAPGAQGNYPTNLFQIFNPATGAGVVHQETLPLNTYAASCAVSPSGVFYFGGALRYKDPVTGALCNSSRLWTRAMPEQDIFVAPTFLDFWQTNNTLYLRLDNVTGLGIVCSNTPSQGWVTVDQPVVTVPGGTNVFVAVTVNRATLNGPTNASVVVAWPGGQAVVPVLCDTPRPAGVITPATAYTLKPQTKSFVLANNGSVPLHFTNSTADAFIANLAPLTGTVAPYTNVTVTYDVTAAAPRPLQGSTGTVTIAHNSYNGLPLVHRVINFPGEFYVSTSGNDANDGLSWTTAWRHIAHGVTNIPNGSVDGGDIVLHVAAGTYAGESTGPAGTNWIIDLSNRQYIHVKGAGPEQSFLTPGSAIWHVNINNDSMPAMPVIRIFNAQGVKFTGFTIDGSTPQTIVNGEGYPEHCALIGVQGGGGILLSGLYLKGTYQGQVYNTLSNMWIDSWDQWWYHGVCVNGIIGPGDVTLQNCLIRGFVRSVYNNNYGYNNIANTNRVIIDHCTLIEQRGPGGGLMGVLSRVEASERGPQFITRSCIIGNAPVDTWVAPLPPNTGNSYGVAGAAAQDASLRVANVAQSNLFWSIVDDHWWNDKVFGSVEGDLPEDKNLTGVSPVFDHTSYLPYSTDISDGDWGWSLIPEPAAGIGLLALAVLLRRRR